MENPILNIESIGCKGKGYNDYTFPVKYFLASLEFDKRTLFGKNIKKSYYIPIKFHSENEIRNIFKYYDNLYFQIIFDREHRKTTVSKSYHISEYKNITHILQKEYKYRSGLTGFSIDFKIKYKNIEVLIISYTHSIHIDKFDDLLCKISNKEFLEYFKNNYVIFPVIINYTVNKKEHDSINFGSIDEAIEYADTLFAAEEKLENKIDSYYSKKTFKLVENL